MSALLSRVLVAIVLIPPVLAAAWYGGIAMLILALIAAGFGLHEYYRMARALRPIPLCGYAGGAGVVIAAYESSISWTIACVLATMLATFLVVAAVSVRESALASLGVTVLGVVWIGYGVAFPVLLRGLSGSNHFGFNVLLAVLIGTWVSDIFAYFGGRLLGRRRLAPAISPNKTVEGFLIGLIFGTAAGWFTLYDQHVTSLQALYIAVAIAIAGPLGDLFESFVKRDLDVKDSGTLLGGHGGVLDRIDALLFSSAAAYFTLLALGRA
jgi:phosphatidate cytidylyltransferase